MAMFALNPTIPAVAAMPGEVKEAIPALTVMMVNGAINLLIAVLILIAGWVAARWISRWVHDLIDRSHYIDDTLKPLISNFARYGTEGTIKFGTSNGQRGTATISKLHNTSLPLIASADNLSGRRGPYDSRGGNG